MYNEELKREFIDFYEGITCDNYLVNLFNHTEQLENVFEKDVCNFVKSEIIDVLRSIGSGSVHNLRGKCSLLRTYTQWCCEKQVSRDNMNHYTEMQTEDFYNCVNKVAYKSKYIDIVQLDSYIEELPNPSDKFLLSAFFEGIKGEEYCEIIECNYLNVDISNNILDFKSTGRKIEVSNKLINYIVEACNEYTYYSFKDNGEYFEARLKSTDETAFKPRDNASNDSDEAKKKRISKRILKLKHDLDAPQITIPRLINSGVIYRVKEKAKQLNISPMDVLLGNEFKNIAERYCMQDVPKFKLKDMYKDFLVD